MLDLADRPLILDGGLSTELEQQGHDISGRLWSAQLLLDAPDAITAAHRAFLDAGADIVTTASYQASPEGFARAGFDVATGRELIRRSVALARRAVLESGQKALVAGSIGPYGAMLADGSEYTGAYDVGLAELRAFHRPRLEMLAEAGADVLAVETIPALAEVEAVLAELDRLGHPAWLSLTSTAAQETRRGEPVAEAYAMAKSVPSVVAVGANCTEPAGIGTTVALAVEASGKPGVVYPNSGEGWDAVNRVWTPAGTENSLIGDVSGWVGSGARIIGGCCRVGPDQIRAISERVRR